MMTPGLLAGIFRVNEENSIRALIPSGSTAAQVLIYLGALFLVALAVFAWAVFRTQHRQRHSHHNRLKPAPNAVSEDAHGKKSFLRSRRNHQRQPEYLPLNPTLAETGGLPPIRTAEPPPPGLIWSV
jgi:hypothetical protein